LTLSNVPKTCLVSDKNVKDIRWGRQAAVQNKRVVQGEREAKQTNKQTYRLTG